MGLTWDLGVTHSNGDQINNSTNVFFTDSGRTVSLDQNSRTSDNNINNNLSLNISRTISKHFTAIFNYAFTQSLNNSGRDTYNYNRLSGKHDLLDSLYSVHNRYTNVTHLPTASIGYQTGNWSAELGAGFRHINQINTIVWKDSLIKLVQNNLNPRLTLSKRFAKNSMWILNYTVNADQPSSDQLAPVQDNTNPLYIKVGNPYLKTSLTHNIQTQLASFTRDYKWRLMISGGAAVTTNQIVNDTYYDQLGRQITGYVNTDGNNAFNVNVNTGTRFKMQEWNLDIGLNATVSSSHSSGFTNHKENVSNNNRVSPEINLALSYKRLLMLYTNAGIDINATSYSLAGAHDINYNTRRALIALHSSPVKRLIVNSSLNYFYNSQLPDGFQKSRAMINASVNYNFLKSEKLSVGVSVVDLLNNNVNINRTVTPNVIETTQSTTLKRYAMVNMAYRFNTFRG